MDLTKTLKEGRWLTFLMGVIGIIWGLLTLIKVASNLPEPSDVDGEMIATINGVIGLVTLIGGIISTIYAPKITEALKAYGIGLHGILIVVGLIIAYQTANLKNIWDWQANLFAASAVIGTSFLGNVLDLICLGVTNGRALFFNAVAMLFQTVGALAGIGIVLIAWSLRDLPGIALDLTPYGGPAITYPVAAILIGVAGPIIIFCAFAFLRGAARRAAVAERT